MLLKVVLLVFGVFVTSTAVIMIKICTVHPVLLAAYRLLIAAAVLSPLFVRDLRANRSSYGLSHLRRSLLPGIMLGAHFSSIIYGLRKTSAVNGCLIANMVPIVMPFLLYLFAREKVKLGEWVGTVLAMAGLVVLTGSDYSLSAEGFMGDVICLVSMVLLGCYFALGRRNRDFPTIWLYVVPLYFAAGVLCFLVSLLCRVSPTDIGSTGDIWLILGLGIAPTVVGHSIMNYSMRHLRGQAVSIVNLGQFVFVGVMAFLLWHEAPQWSFYIACPLLVSGALLALRSTPDTIRSAEID